MCKDSEMPQVTLTLLELLDLPVHQEWCWISYSAGTVTRNIEEAGFTAKNVRRKIRSGDQARKVLNQGVHNP